MNYEASGGELHGLRQKEKLVCVCIYGVIIQCLSLKERRWLVLHCFLLLLRFQKRGTKSILLEILEGRCIEVMEGVVM